MISNKSPAFIRYLRPFSAPVARRFRHQMMCVCDPVDRVIASSLDFPFERVERDRQLFGETQSILREVNLHLRRPVGQNDALKRHREVRLGIEALYHLVFGIKTERSRIAERGEGGRKLKNLFLSWEMGDFGDPDELISAIRFIIDVGKKFDEDVERKYEQLKGGEKVLRKTQFTLSQDDLDADERDFLEALEIGLRFHLFFQYGRSFGDDHLFADGVIDDAQQIYQERLSGAFGLEPNATFRWIVEIGRALREKVIAPN